MTAPSETIIEAFAASESIVPHKNGYVDFDAFFSGTWDIGDEILSKATTQIGADSASFEAMSFMLHPNDAVLPLETRLDGMIAIGVCNAIEPGALYGMNDLHAYVGYYSSVPSHQTSIDITLPRSSVSRLSVKVFDIAASGYTSTYTITAEPGDTIHLPEPKTAQTSFWFPILGAAVSLAVSMFVAIWTGKPATLARGEPV